jgi:hypothetical protein
MDLLQRINDEIERAPGLLVVVKAYFERAAELHVLHGLLLEEENGTLGHFSYMRIPRAPAIKPHEHFLHQNNPFA